MQPQEQISASFAQSSGLGAELLSLMQLLFFLALGYAVSKMTMYFSRPPTKAEAFAKKIDEDEPEKPIENTPEDVCGEPEESTSSPSNKVKARHSNAQERKKLKKMKEANKVEPREEVVETPSLKPAAPVQEEAKEVKEDATTNDRVAKLMAKKSERKAKKALEKKQLEEKIVDQEGECPVEEPSAPLHGESEDGDIIAAETEVMSGVEATAGEAQTTSSISMVSIVSEPLDEVEAQLQSESTQCGDDDDEVVATDHEQPADQAEMDTTTSEVGSIDVGALEGISTPEVCLTPRDMGASPLLWCGVPQTEFSSGCESAPFPPLVPQIEGWMPILVPAEHAPPGAFDGIWKNSLDERIVIQHSEITFDSGIKWAIRMHSHTMFSVEVEDEEFEAELDPETRCLEWSDGDTWTCIGQTENQQQWATVTQSDPDVPCLLWEGAQVAGEAFFPAEMPPQPLNTQIPEDAKNWEICWDWKKKGWCPRGVACDWYHPCVAAPSQNFCAPCGDENFDGPFADEQGF